MKFKISQWLTRKDSTEKPIDKVKEIPADFNFKETLLKKQETAERVLPELFAEAIKTELLECASYGHKRWYVDVKDLNDPFKNIRNIPDFCENLSESLGGCKVYFKFKTLLNIEWADNEEAEGGKDDE